MTELIVRGPEPEIVEIRLNHPERLNAVDETTFGALGAALDEIAADPSVRVVLLGGEGRAFCAGANYKRHVTGERTATEREAYLQVLLDGCERLRRFPLPIVAVVQGFAVGIGLEMALNCDFIVLGESAELGLPEVAIGTFVGGGVTATLPRTIGLARAKRMVILGERLRGADAVAAGLATSCVPDAELAAAGLAVARRVARQAPIPVRFAKRLLNEGLETGAARTAEHHAILTCMASEDWAEGVRAFAEKRAPVYRGR